MPMTRKRKTKQNLMKKQKQLIIHRLMELNIKVEDYVYKYKPISTCDAEAYIKEVEGYIDKCSDDERCMQVIEKLIRCMKGVIEEQNEFQNFKSNYAVIEDENMDEDLTQIPDELEVAIKETKTNNISTEHVLLNENMPIDLIVSSQYETKELRNHNQDVDILHRAISELSIQEADNLSGSNNEMGECSQSVLANFTINDTSIRNKQNKTVPTQMDLNNFVQANITTVIEDTRSNFQPNITVKTKGKDLEEYIEVNNIPTEKVKCRKNPIIEGNTRRRKLLNVASLANNVADVRTTEFTADRFQEIEENIARRKRKPRKIARNLNKDNGNGKKQSRNKKKLSEEPKQRKPRKVNKNLRMDKKQTRNKKSADKNKTSEERKPEKQDILFVNNDLDFNGVNEINNKQKNLITTITASTIQNLWPQKHVNTGVQLNGSNNATIEKPILNRVVENDLSWIENLRYVREISKEETLPSYYDDSFWENYMLPNDWNDSEFL